MKFLFLSLLIPVFLLGFISKSFMATNHDKRTTNEYGFVRIPLVKNCEVYVPEHPLIEYIEVIEYSYFPESLDPSRFLLVKHTGMHTDIINLFVNEYNKCWPINTVTYSNLDFFIFDMKDPQNPLHNATNFKVEKDGAKVIVNY